MRPCARCHVIARRERETPEQAQDYCSNCEARMSYSGGGGGRARSVVDRRTHQSVPIGTPRGMVIGIRDLFLGHEFADLAVRFVDDPMEPRARVAMHVVFAGRVPHAAGDTIDRWLRGNAPRGIRCEITVSGRRESPIAHALVLD